MNWDHIYDIKASKNIRGENVYDVFQKGTNYMVWADIPVKDIDKFLQKAVKLIESVANEEIDSILSEES